MRSHFPPISASVRCFCGDFSLAAGNKTIPIEREKIANELKGKKNRDSGSEFFEQIELTKPMAALKEAGAEAKIVSPGFWSDPGNESR
jgi:hypothetical protein